VYSYHSNDQSRSWRLVLRLQSAPRLLYRHHKQSVSLSIQPCCKHTKQNKSSMLSWTSNREQKGTKYYMLSTFAIKTVKTTTTTFHHPLLSFRELLRSGQVSQLGHVQRVFLQPWCSPKSSLSRLELVLVHPHRRGLGNGSLKVDDADKCYTGGPKEREWLC